MDSLKYVQPVQVVPIGDPVPALTLDQKYIPNFSYSNQRSSLSAPKSSYGAPSPSYGAPSPSYGAPSPSYGAPTPSYGAPSTSYEAPSPSYGAPAPSYTATKSKPGYKKPSTSSSYHAPSLGSTYSAPSSGYSVGSISPASTGYNLGLISSPSSGYNSVGSVSGPKITSGATQSYGSGSSYSTSYSTGFNQELAGSSQTRSVREGRIEECYCVAAALCPRNLVVGAQTRDYGSLIDPRVNNPNSNISAEENPTT